MQSIRQAYSDVNSYMREMGVDTDAEATEEMRQAHHDVAMQYSNSRNIDFEELNYFASLMTWGTIQHGAREDLDVESVLKGAIFMAFFVGLHLGENR